MCPAETSRAPVHVCVSHGRRVFCPLLIMRIYTYLYNIIKTTASPAVGQPVGERTVGWTDERRENVRCFFNIFFFFF